MPTATAKPFVPDDFEVPRGLDHPLFALRPLGVEHNERDYAAWTTSIVHIAATPGFIGEAWPHPMGLADNHGDLMRHAADFAARRGFTYTVIDADHDVIGCVYIYPGRREGDDARVSSWVRQSRAEVDPILHRAVTAWLAELWPFERIEYAPRPGDSESG